MLAIGSVEIKHWGQVKGFLEGGWCFQQCWGHIELLREPPEWVCKGDGPGLLLLAGLFYFIIILFFQ